MIKGILATVLGAVAISCAPPAAADMPSSELVKAVNKVGPSICAVWKQRGWVDTNDLEKIGTILINAGYEAGDAGSIVWSSTDNFCPEYDRSLMVAAKDLENRNSHRVVQPTPTYPHETGPATGTVGGGIGKRTV